MSMFIAKFQAKRVLYYNYLKVLHFFISYVKETNNRTFYTTIAALSKSIALCHQTIRNAMRDLRDANLLEYKRIKGGKWEITLKARLDIMDTEIFTAYNKIDENSFKGIQEKPNKTDEENPPVSKNFIKRIIDIEKQDGVYILKVLPNNEGKLGIII